MMLIFQHESPMAVTVMSLCFLPSAGGLQKHVVDERCPWVLSHVQIASCVLRITQSCESVILFVFFFLSVLKHRLLILELVFLQQRPKWVPEKSAEEGQMSVMAICSSGACQPGRDFSLMVLSRFCTCARTFAST